MSAITPFVFSEGVLLSQIQLKYGLNIEAVIAIDEVGRGCVAGPVLTCASLWISCNSLIENNFQNWIKLVKDSKKLTPAKRLICYKQVLDEFNYTSQSLPFKNSVSLPRIELLKPKNVMSFSLSSRGEPTGDTAGPIRTTKNSSQFTCIGFCLGEGDIMEVEEFNIWNAVQIAASRALLGLKEYFLDPLNLATNQLVLLMDGNKSISVPAAFLNVIQATAIKGDDLFVSVGLSSILAKVHRDLFMESQENIYPKFGFAKHKGYGTAQHLENIQKHGICELHRKSFLRNYIN